MLQKLFFGSSSSKFISRSFSTIGLRNVVKKGIVSPRLSVPPHVVPTPYAYNAMTIPPMEGPVELKQDEATLNRMRVAGRIARAALTFAGTLAKPGVTTDSIDVEVHRFILEKNAFPSPWNYYGFPKSICTSVNEIICHGIPDSRKLENGDILKVDVSVYIDGVHGDCCHTFLVGEVDEAGKKLVKVTQEALHAAINVCGPGVKMAAIADAICSHVYANDFDVSRRYCGHGIGKHLHMTPFVYHTTNIGNDVMSPGMTFTIEPVVTEGSAEDEVWDDGWSAITKDGGRGAQFEHTILITPVGVEILTI